MERPLRKQIAGFIRNHSFLPDKQQQGYIIALYCLVLNFIVLDCILSHLM